MEALTLIRQAQDAGLTVEAQGDKLLVQGPQSAELIVRRLVQHKPAILKALRQRTPGSFLSSLSLHFADHADHPAILSRYCELADEYHQQHGMAVGEAASHAFTGTLVEYGDGGAAAMLRPSTLAKLPRSSAPMEQMLFVYQPPPQKRSRKRRQQREGKRATSAAEDS